MPYRDEVRVESDGESYAAYLVTYVMSKLVFRELSQIMIRSVSRYAYLLPRHLAAAPR